MADHEPIIYLVWLMIKRKIYNWHHDSCPVFEYDLSAVESKLYEYASLTGKIYGVQESVTQDQKIHG